VLQIVRNVVMQKPLDTVLGASTVTMNNQQLTLLNLTTKRASLIVLVVTLKTKLLIHTPAQKFPQI
jgi:hypothetical protein